MWARTILKGFDFTFSRCSGPRIADGSNRFYEAKAEQRQKKRAVREGAKRGLVHRQTKSRILFVNRGKHNTLTLKPDSVPQRGASSGHAAQAPSHSET